MIDANPATEYYAIRYCPNDDDLPGMEPCLDNTEIDAWDREMVKLLGPPYLRKLAGCESWPPRLFEVTF